MSSADYHSSIPVVPATPPQIETTADGLGWLLNALAQALAAHFVSVLCIVLRGRHRRRDRK